MPVICGGNHLQLYMGSAQYLQIDLLHGTSIWCTYNFGLVKFKAVISAVLDLVFFFAVDMKFQQTTTN